MSFHRNTVKELAYFFVGSGECLSNRFEITGFKFLNVEKCLKIGDFFLKSRNGLGCGDCLNQQEQVGWLTQIYLWCIRGQAARQSRDCVYNGES